MQVEFLTAALAVVWKFMETGEEYSHSDSRTLSGSMRLLCSQLVDVVSVDAVELLLRMLRKESWEVRSVLVVVLA